MNFRQLPCAAAIVLAAAVPSVALFADDQPAESGEWRVLFPEDGQPEGWQARHWADVSQPAHGDAKWEVKDGVLLGGEPRGNWLISDEEFSDFILEYEFKLGARGNSGCALRTPAAGDPAFDGLELQMADLRYNLEAKPSELTGGLYRAIAPKQQIYLPEQWNRYRIELRGSLIKVDLNGHRILDLDMAEEDGEVRRHNGQAAPPIKDRPRRGHLGFQELSRGGGRVMIRGARLMVLGE